KRMIAKRPRYIILPRTIISAIPIAGTKTDFQSTDRSTTRLPVGLKIPQGRRSLWQPYPQRPREGLVPPALPGAVGVCCQCSSIKTERIWRRSAPRTLSHFILGWCLFSAQELGFLRDVQLAA